MGDSVSQVKFLGYDLTKALIESYARGIDVVVDLTASERDRLRRALQPEAGDTRFGVVTRAWY
jgi:hypothetical protein